MTLPTIAALIPTRDRGELAMAAVRSLLDQDCPIEIFVSDNGDTPDRGLADFCEGHGDRGIHYIRPAAPLSQPGHWDWALRQAMERSQATHFTVHYDRKYSKPDQFGQVRLLAERRPDSLISWPCDFVAEIPPPTRLWQVPWTGKVYTLTTAPIVELTAAGRATAIYSHALPLLSNCLVPRPALAAMIDRFGNLCDSATPDTCFAFRFAALRDDYLHLDRPIGIIRAPQRSSGAGYMRGEGDEWQDFQKAWGERPWLAAAPIPGLNLGLNILYHEYELVRREVGDRFPPIQFAPYLDDLATGLGLIGDPDAKSAFRRLLKEKGWPGRDRSRPLRTLLRHTFLGFLDEHLGLRLPGVPGRVFRDDEKALGHALAHPRRPQKSSRHLATLAPVMTGKEV